MRLTIEQIEAAVSLIATGVHKQNIATIYNVDTTTLRRYIRAYNRYGKSFWTDEPDEEKRYD